MDLNRFKNKISDIKNEANNLLAVTTEQENINKLDKFVNDLSILEEFLKDESNLEVISKSENKNDVDNQPLDHFCQNILSKLREIDKLLNKEVLYFMQHQNNANSMNNIKSSRDFDNLNSKINQQAFKNAISAFNVLKHLYGHYKTLIILGPNGSGKTSFANLLKGVDNHVKVIPASKPIKAMGYISNMYNSTISTFNTEIYAGGDLKEELLQKLIIGICNEHDNIARKYLDTGVRDVNTTYEKVKRIFDGFFDVKLDNSDFGTKKLKQKKIMVHHLILMI